MIKIPNPQLPWHHPDRLLHCEEMLEPAFLDLVERAQASGWAPGEVTLALRSLAGNYAHGHEGMMDIHTDG